MKYKMDVYGLKASMETFVNLNKRLEVLFYRPFYPLVNKN